MNKHQGARRLEGKQASQTTLRRHKNDCSGHHNFAFDQEGMQDLSQDGSKCLVDEFSPKDGTH